MANLVTENAIPGLTVYGVQQMQYTVDGLAGQDFAAAQKVDDLGDALAVLAKALASMTTDKQDPDDKSDADSALTTAAGVVAGYGITTMTVSDNKIKRGDAMKAQNDIQYALDVEDNQMQQDTVSLQSLLTKRDNAFSNASKIVKKALNASGSAIGNM